jgi:hypothetical protein
MGYKNFEGHAENPTIICKLVWYKEHWPCSEFPWVYGFLNYVTLAMPFKLSSNTENKQSSVKCAYLESCYCI